MSCVFARVARLARGAVLAGLCALGVASNGESRTIPPLVSPGDGGAPWTEQDRAALQADLETLFRSAKAIRGAHAGLFVADTRDGSVLFARSSDDEFMPASTLKLVVGSVALARLGTDFRFHTRAIVTGPIRDGVLNGSLVLRGGGDPFLREADLSALAGAVFATGVRRISAGDVRVDSSYFDAQPYPPGWVWDDFPFYYAPVVSASSFEENVVHLSAAPGTKAGDVVRVTAAPIGQVAGSNDCPPALDGRIVVLPLATTAATGTESTIDVDRVNGCIAVTGAIGVGVAADTVDAAVPSPDRYVRDALLGALGKQVALADGVSAPPGSGYQQTSIWAHDSEPMPKLLADMWYPSDNLLAELLLKSLGVARSGVPGTTENGAALELEYLRGIGVDPKTVTLRDGSGLSIYDRITPRDLVAVLQADWNGPNRALVLDALPVAGVRGTLREEFVDTPAAGRAFVKTGSMSHVRGLAGFVATKRHGAVTFALMVDDWNGVSGELDAFRGAVLTRLVGE